MAVRDEARNRVSREPSGSRCKRFAFLFWSRAGAQRWLSLGAFERGHPPKQLIAGERGDTVNGLFPESSCGSGALANQTWYRTSFAKANIGR